MAATTAAPTMPAATAELTHRQVLVVLSGLMAGMFVSALDQTIVSTALPTIVGDFKALDDISWVASIYLLTSTATMPIAGKLSDLYGRLISQWRTELTHVTNILGGAESQEKYGSQKGVRFTPVSRQRQKDAVLVFTRGLIDGLNDDELAAVAAHEIVHIVNGDIRLNIRMLGVLVTCIGIGPIGFVHIGLLAETIGAKAATVVVGAEGLVVMLMLSRLWRTMVCLFQPSQHS